MAPVPRDESKSLVTLPKNKNISMSYEDTLREMEAFLDGKLEKPKTEPTNSSAIKLPEDLDPDATENSSSFGDTTSRSEVTSVTSDAEVESEYRVDDGLGSMFDGFGGGVFPLRNKKLTNHWRNFIRPLMWRCKWTELKIRELESQARKYTQELEPNDQTKMLELQQDTSDFYSKAMKRRKRKLVENVTDISSYMSQHHIFSYLENKKSDQDSSATPEDDCNKEIYSKNDEFDVDDEWLKYDDDSMEQIIRQIGTAQSQVHKLRNHLDKVMSKNGVKFSSSENLSLLVPYDGQTSTAHSPDFSTGSGDNMSLGPTYSPQNLLDFDIGDLVLPESILSSYVDVTQIPDVIESTVGLLSAADVTIHQSQIIESAENILEDTLIPTNVPQGEIMSNQAIDHSTDKASDKTGLVVNSVVEDDTPFEKSTLKSCITSDVPAKNKGKRGERKAGPGGWNLICSGEPDSN